MFSNDQVGCNYQTDHYLADIRLEPELVDMEIKKVSHRNLKFPECDLDNLNCFTPTTQDEDKKLVLNSFSATYENNPLSTPPIKQHIDKMVPQITRIINKSLETGCVPGDIKHPQILPLIKKDNLDRDILDNYWPVSSLTF